MEPPAPVTSTRWDSSDRRTPSRSVATGVRPKRSSMLGSRARRMANMPRAAGDHVVHGGQHLHGDAGCLGRVEHVGDHLRRRVGYGEEHLLEHVAARRGRDVPDAPDDGHSDERHPVHRCVVVEHGDRDQPGVGMADHFAHGRRRIVAAPDDRHPQSVAPRAALPGEDARLEADQAHAEGRQDQADHNHLGVHHLISGQLDGRVDDEEDGGHRPAREDHLTGFFEPGMTPHAAVQAVDLIADQGHDHHDEHEELEVPAVRGRGDIAPVEDFGRAVRRPRRRRRRAP